MHIRAETLADYPQITDVEMRAFEDRTDVAMIVALHRQRVQFDPELSLVAEHEGRIIGHVLFSAHWAQILGQSVRTVNLSPLAVDPAFQRQGIGGLLLDAGHRIARAKGFAFSFLLGHPDYYPRFGYLTQAYGISTLTLAANGVADDPLIAQSVRSEHIDELYALWQETESNVDFALDPGHMAADWISPSPGTKSVIYRDTNGALVGYARIDQAKPTAPRAFLARNPEWTQRIANHIATEANSESVILPLHPNSRATPGGAAPDTQAWMAAMVYPLQPSIFDDYYRQVQNGTRPPGSPVWSPIFDFD